jgi:hypothetical protein
VASMHDDDGNRKLRVVKRKKGSRRTCSRILQYKQASLDVADQCKRIRLIAFVAANRGGGLAHQNSDKALRIACGPRDVKLLPLFTCASTRVGQPWRIEAVRSIEMVEE